MRQAAAPVSGLPSLMMPCPACAGRMAFRSRTAISAEIEDTIYACGSCGAEVVRSSIRKSAEIQDRHASRAA